MRSGRVALLAAVLVAFTGLVSTEAAAKCTRLAFSVNDYGKDGPTRDAKQLLKKYVAKWTADRGIKRYRTSRKTVKCELFLDFGFFDEHTCRAEATVCWGGRKSKPAKKAKAKPAPKAAEKDPAAKKKSG